MQLFLISPAIVYLIYKFRVKIMPISILLILGCVGCMVATHLKYEIRRKIMMEKAIDSKAYVPMHLRFSPWLIGIITAYILFETRNRTIRIPKIFNISAWTVSIALMVVVVFFRYPLQQTDSTATPLEYALYDALSRIVWSIALFYIVFACVNKYGGCLNWFLSHPLWLPLSRLSFSIYLLHYYVTVVIMGGTKTAPVFTEWNLICTFIKVAVITILVSIVASLVFESPIVIFEKYLFGSTKSSRQNNDTGIEKNRA
ncbi:O-acyltransferase like protein-like [Sitodiplosis mosellana]|uniref:O-acyltransferase like protein-like n=1 Tax=Sitodiplosis mosellana TaxID=263140 RepID=UPI002445034F|nr:O-acyltransferase like protein-like [Sitodiplosis mosellana]